MKIFEEAVKPVDVKSAKRPVSLVYYQNSAPEMEYENGFRERIKK